MFKKLVLALKSFLARIVPVTVRRFIRSAAEQEEAVKRLEDGQNEILNAVRRLSESVDLAKELVRASESAVSDLQPQIQNGIAEVEDAVHWRGSRMESAMEHLIPREELSFEIALAEHCNLNCAGCDHFSPVSEPEFADLEEYTKDFRRITELFGNHVGEVHLLGGEPLLHPNVTGFFRAARESFPEATIDVTTNGVLLLSEPESFWTSCRENRIVIRPTKYPIPLNFEKIEALAAQHGVEYRYIGNTGTVLKMMDRYKLDVCGLQNGNKSFLFCHRANSCVYLAHGRLYTCTVAPTVRHFNKAFGQDLKLTPEDSVDIYQVGSAREIMEFLARPIPFCRYCNVEGTEHNVPWSQSKKSIEEWT